MLLTLDASVLVAAFKEDDAHHGVAEPLWLAVCDGTHRVTCPETVLVEFAGAIRRQVKGGEAAAPKAVDLLRSVLTVRWGRIDRDRAVRTAIRASLKGMDAIVVAHAREAGAVLVSLDDEILERGKAEVITARPEEIPLET